MPADEQPDQTSEGGCSLLLLVHSRACSAIPVACRSLGAPRPPCPPRLPCHSGSPRTMTEHLDDVPGTRFLRLLYIKDPAWKPRPRFFGEKSASTALTAIAGCRGGYREKQASRVAGTTSCTMRLSGPGGVRHAVVIGSKALAAAARAERWRCFHRPAVVGW
jgi:hypothetical protein